MLTLTLGPRAACALEEHGEAAGLPGGQEDEAARAARQAPPSRSAQKAARAGGSSASTFTAPRVITGSGLTPRKLRERLAQGAAAAGAAGAARARGRRAAGAGRAATVRRSAGGDEQRHAEDGDGQRRDHGGDVGRPVPALRDTR